MAVETLSGVPCYFESGNTVIFEEVFSDFPASSWAATLCLWLNGVAASPVTAAEDGDTFIFTLSATVTAALTPGNYDYAIYVSSGSERTTAKRGRVKVQPNLATSQTPSFNRTQRDALRTVVATFNSTDKQSVSFNGQSFTRAGLDQYQSQLTIYEARVLREEELLRVEEKDSTIGPRF